MENHIVGESARTMRSIARQALEGNWKKIAIGYAIYYILSSLIPAVLDSYFFYTETIEVAGEQFAFNVGKFSGIYDVVLSGAFQLGFVVFFLSFLRTRVVRYSNLFEGFNHFVKALALYILYSLIVALWSLLFIIPGIVAIFKYSQAFYILADHPEYSPWECLNESKRLMYGNKEHLFMFEFSYIGWMFIGLLPQNLFIQMTNIESVPLFMLIQFITAIPAFFAYAYFYTGNAVFYDLLIEKLRATPKETVDNYETY
ncbi:MAG: DUF975 family protein [Clostridia bacterium]|nr:DUF975 family protein [Clostridia bacterium]